MCFPMCSAHLVNSRASVPAVSRCHPSFVKVRCNWSIRVASVFHRFALVCPSFWNVGPDWSIHVSLVLCSFDVCLPVFLHCSLWLVESRAICALQFSVLSQFYIVHGDWFIHVSSVLNRYFGSHPPSPRRGAGASLC